MKITAFESGLAGASDESAAAARILPANFRETVQEKRRANRPKTSREEAIEVAMAALADVPDEREDIVAEIKAKIERGEYRINGEEVADMMIRRMKADRIR